MRRRGPFVVVGVAAALLATAGLADAAFTVATTAGPEAVSSGTLATSDSVNAGPACASTSASCTTSLVGTPTLSSAANQAIAYKDTGSVSALASTLSTGVCGLQQAAEPVGSDTALAAGGVTYLQAGPAAGWSAVALDGSTGWLETSASYTNPTPYSISAWFMFPAGNTTGGSIIGFTNSQGATGTQYDRHLWVDDTGHLVFGNYNGATIEVTSPGTYNDGAWHHVVVTQGTRRQGGDELWVDGTRVARDTTNADMGAQSYTGWWHVGWAKESGWPDAPTSAFFPGSLAGVAVFNGTYLSSTQIGGLYTAASPAAYQSAATTDGATQYWGLQDTGTVPYSGALPGYAGTSYPDLTGNDSGTGQGTLAPDTAGPLGATATAFDGSTGWVQTPAQQTEPQTYSLAGWFKTPNGSTAGGSIIGFANAQGQTGGDHDRQVWVDATGHVVFGVYPQNHVVELKSPSTYNDGGWHFVVAADDFGVGEYLYVDGSLVASDTAAGDQGDQPYNGWWHLGWAGLNGWADASASYYFNGSLAGIAVFPTALSGSAVSALQGSATFSGYLGSALGDGATAVWPLAAPTACQAVDVTVSLANGTTSCLLPAGAGACPALGAGATLDTLGSRQLATGAIAGGATSTVTISLQVDAAAAADTSGTNPGADLNVIFSSGSLVATHGGWSATLNHPVVGPIHL